MTKTVDIGSKRLASLAPMAWARWCTGDDSMEAVEILVVQPEFKWSRLMRRGRAGSDLAEHMRAHPSLARHHTRSG
jgi:hypothetical protein